jgi:CheY-like chemotaxis protein
MEVVMNPMLAPTRRSGESHGEPPVRVLVAEPDLLLRDSIQDALETAGLDVMTASGGAEAIRLARQLRFDVVLSDVQLPDLAGTEVTRAVRSEAGSPVVLLLCRWPPRPELVRAAARAGAVRVVSAPIVPATLAQAVQRLADGEAA